MATPQVEQVIALANEYNLIPIARTLLADMETPIRIFRRIAQRERAFLLESVEGGSQWARYSFIGTDPFLTISAKKGDISIERAGGEERLRSSRPVDELKAILRGYRSPKLPEMPPFTGGAIGFFGYDLLQYYEKLPAHQVDDLNLQDMQFMFCDTVIVFDHVKQRILLVANVHVKPGDRDEDIRRAYAEAELKLDQAADLLQQDRKSVV